MYVLKLYRPYAHLIATGQMQMVSTRENPVESILGPVAIMNSRFDYSVTLSQGGILLANGADIGTVDDWKTSTRNHVVAIADITQHGTFDFEPDNILRATSTSIQTMTASQIEAVLRPFIAVPYFLRLANVKVIQPPLELRDHQYDASKSIFTITDAGVSRQLEERAGPVVEPIEPVVVP